MSAFAATLLVHTNFTGSVQPDTSADALCLGGVMVIDPDTNILYVIADRGSLFRQVRMFDALTGGYLGILGRYDALFGAASPAALHIAKTSFGKWLVMSCGEVWGQQMQWMGIDATAGVGSVSNQLTPVYDGIQAGGNNGFLDVDANGHLWICTTDFTGTYGGVPRLIQIMMASAGAIGYVGPASGTLLNAAPWNFVGGNSGVWADKASGTLLLSGTDATGTIMMRVDPGDPSIILASSRTAGAPSGQFCVGQNGTYLSDQFNILRSSDFALIFSHSHYDYGYSDLFVNGEAYDSVQQVMFVFKSFWPFTKALDVNNPTGSGAVQLADPTPTVSNSADVGFGTVSPNGGVFVTAWNDGTQAYIDFWMVGTPQPRYYWGHGLNLLSSYPIVA